MTMIPDEMIVSDRFVIRFLRLEGTTMEIVDRHHADRIEITSRLPDGKDGQTILVRFRADHTIDVAH